MSTPGHIRQRSARSWEIKYDADSASGRRVTRYVSVKGSKRDARRRLTQLLAAVDAGTEVAPDKTTVASALRTWLGGPHGLSAKTAERYGQLAEQQIIPFIGRTMLQKLKPATSPIGTTRCWCAVGRTARLYPRVPWWRRINCCARYWAAPSHVRNWLATSQPESDRRRLIAMRSRSYSLVNSKPC